MLLPASLLTGVLWQAHGPQAALGIGALLAALAALMLLWVGEPGASGRDRVLDAAWR
jgi:hypothetical protein